MSKKDDDDDKRAWRPIPPWLRAAKEEPSDEERRRNEPSALWETLLSHVRGVLDPNEHVNAIAELSTGLFVKVGGHVVGGDVAQARTKLQGVTSPVWALATSHRFIRYSPPDRDALATFRWDEVAVIGISASGMAMVFSSPARNGQATAKPAMLDVPGHLAAPVVKAVVGRLYASARRTGVRLTVTRRTANIFANSNPPPDELASTDEVISQVVDEIVEGRRFLRKLKERADAREDDVRRWLEQRMVALAELIVNREEAARVENEPEPP